MSLSISLFKVVLSHISKFLIYFFVFSSSSCCGVGFVFYRLAVKFTCVGYSNDKAYSIKI